MVNLLIKHYEQFLRELRSAGMPELPSRPKHLSLITVYPDAAPKDQMYSRRVLFDNLPFNRNLEVVVLKLRSYGRFDIQWKSKDYALITFEECKSVFSLVEDSTMNDLNQYVYHYGDKKSVRYRPWKHLDKQCVFKINVTFPQEQTVLLSGLPSTSSAIEIGSLVGDRFGCVSRVSVDTDQLDFPTGTATVSFYTYMSHFNALTAKTIPFSDSGKFTNVTISPYFRDNQICEVCSDDEGHKAVWFCADLHCPKYFCVRCWNELHRNKPDKHVVFLRSNYEPKPFIFCSAII